jgi:hypothetical protein
LLTQPAQQAEQQLEQPCLSGLVVRAGPIWRAQGGQQAGQLRPKD